MSLRSVRVLLTSHPKRVALFGLAAVLISGPLAFWAVQERRAKEEARALNAELEEILGATEADRDRLEQNLATAIHLTKDGLGELAADEFSGWQLLQQVRADLLQQVLAFYDELVRQEPRDFSLRRIRAEWGHDLARAQRALGLDAAAEKTLRKHLASLKPWFGQEGPDAKRAAARLSHSLGSLLGLDRHNEAIAAFSDAETLLREVLEEVPNDPLVLCSLGEALAGSAGLMLDAQQLARAIARYKLAVATFEQAQAQDDAFSGWRSGLSIALDGLGAAHLRLGNNADARVVLEQCLTVLRPLRESDPDDAAVVARLLRTRTAVANACLRLGELELALQHAERGHSLGEFLIPRSPQNPQYLVYVGDLFSIHGLILGATGDGQASRIAYRRTLALTEPALTKRREDTELGRVVAFARYNLGASELLEGNLEEARAQMLRGAVVAANQLARVPDNFEMQRIAIALHFGAAEVDLQEGLHHTLPKHFASSVSVSLEPAQTGVDVARFLCRGMALAEEDPELSDEQRSAALETYAAFAIESLGSFAETYPARRAELRDPSLACLFDRAGFHELLKAQ